MKNFLFDLYGTLLDIETDEESKTFWKKISRTLNRVKSGGELKERYRSLCKQAKSALPPDGEIELTSFLRQLLLECGLPDSTSDVLAFAKRFRTLSVRRCRPFRGALKLLRKLKKNGAKLYLLSNAQSCFTYSEIEACGLAPLFDGILLSSETGWKKPSPRFFEAAFQQFSLAPESCLYVGNDLHDDVGGAHAVNMKCVYIQSPQSGKYQNPPEPDFFAANRKELEKILLNESKNA